MEMLKYLSAKVSCQHTTNKICKRELLQNLSRSNWCNNGQKW